MSLAAPPAPVCETPPTSKIQELRVAGETHFIRRHIAHVLEHPRAVPGNNASILFGSTTNSESVGHGRNGSICDGERPVKHTLRVNDQIDLFR